MNVKAVLDMSPATIATLTIPTVAPWLIGDAMANRYFNGRNGTETRISREELAALLTGAAEIALKHCERK